MSQSVNFEEIANYCIDQVKQDCLDHPSSQKGYSTALYVAITEDNQIRLSQTPHILKDAKRCYIIHKWRNLAATLWYAAYKVQSINEKGEVGDGQLDDEYSLHIQWAHFDCRERIELLMNGETVYSAGIWKNGQYNLAREISYVWELYRKCKSECSTLMESKLLGKLAATEQGMAELKQKLADSTVKERLLEDEIKAYRSLLDEIKTVVEKRGEF